MLMLLLAMVKLADIALMLWRSGMISDWIVAPGEPVVWLDVAQELCVDDWLDVVETEYEVDVDDGVDELVVRTLVLVVAGVLELVVARVVEGLEAVEGVVILVDGGSVVK
jgi:hypothetical protein